MEKILCEVPDQSAETLLKQIKLHIEPGTTIVSECWKVYKASDLQDAGFTHKTVNHKTSFVDPDTGPNTLKVERMWGSAKWQNKRHRGTARQHLTSYLAEHM